MSEQKDAPILTATPKDWYKSKLILMGIIECVISVLNLLPPLLQKGSVNATDVVMLFSGVLTIVLRKFFTTQPIA